MQNTVAFICPLYDMDNHFEMALGLYKSKLKYEIDADMVFIFSNEEQKDRFGRLCEKECQDEKPFCDVIPVEMDKYSSKAAVKKLYGLSKYMGVYEYIIITDCEATIIRHFNAREVAKEIWDTRSVLSSNISARGFFIMRECYKAMGLYYNKKLREMLGNYKYNFWFNEMQVYKCDILPEFFGWLDGLDKEKIFNTWSCFEYYVFYAYLCLVHDVSVRKYKFIGAGGVNEAQYIFGKKKQQRILDTMQLHWTTSIDVIPDNICMLFHLDRRKAFMARYEKSNNVVVKKMIILLKRVRYVLNVIFYFIARCYVLVWELPEYIKENKKL